MLAFLIRAHEWILRRLCGPVRGPDGVPVEYWPDFRRRDARVLVERMGRILPWAWTWDDTVDRHGRPRPPLPFTVVELMRTGDLEGEHHTRSHITGTLWLRVRDCRAAGALSRFALAVLEQWDENEGPRSLLDFDHRKRCEAARGLATRVMP